MSAFGWIVLLLAAAAAVWLVLRRRPGSPRPTPTVPAGDDLGSLGLSEVRAAGAGEPEAVRPGPTARPVPASGAPSAPSGETVSAPRPAPARPSARPGPATSVAPDAALWPEDPSPAQHLLASLAAHVGGAAGVLRYDPVADTYVTEAAAGVERPDPLPAEACPLHRAPQDGELTLLDEPVGPFEGGVVVRALAAPPATRAYLVVSGVGDGVPAHVGAFADLLADLSDLTPPPAPPSRVDLIRDEQDAARADGRALAFALVTLAEAEDILAREGPAQVADAERRLRERLADDDDVRRTEPFGDLLVGVFLDLDPDGVAAWCERTSAGDPALFIGAVAPVDGDAADVRSAAAAALHDAYDQQRTQVVSG